MSLYPFTLNGQDYNLSDFVGLNYLNGIPDAIEDLIRQVTNRYGLALSNSPTFSTGNKNLTGLQGALFKIGDYVVCTGVGFSAVMSGTVTAFNPVTGTMTVNMDAATGSGTGTTAIAKLGETSNLKNLTSALEPLFGGTGAGGTFSRVGADLSSVFGSSSAGQGASLWDAMAPIYDECFISPYPMDSGFQLGDNGQSTPWYLYNCAERNVSDENLTEGVPQLTAAGICVCIDTPSVQSAIATYGDRGFVSATGGALRYDCVLRADYDGQMLYRFGLKGEGSSRINNIFSYSGIGFELNPSNGGFLNFVVGTGGGVYRQTLLNTAKGLTTGKNCRFYFETDQEGTQVDFYVNDIFAASYGGNLPNGTTNQRDLMHPAFEASVSSGRSSLGLFIDTLNVRKTLSR